MIQVQASEAEACSLTDDKTDKARADGQVPWLPPQQLCTSPVPQDRLGWAGAGSGRDPGSSGRRGHPSAGLPRLAPRGTQGAPAGLRRAHPSPRAPDPDPCLLRPRTATQGCWSDPGPLQRPGAGLPGTRGPGVWTARVAVRLFLKGQHSAFPGDKAEKSRHAKGERFPNRQRQTRTRAHPGRTHSFRHT